MSDLAVSCTHCGARWPCPDSVATTYAGRRVTRWCESCHRLFDVEFPPIRTLGDLLFATPHPPLVSESEWVALVQAVASGNEEALRALYGRMRGIVLRFMLSATHERQMAEALTLAVFHDVWRRASAYSLGDGSVVGWIMNLAQRGMRRNENRRALDVLADLSREQPLQIAGTSPVVSSDWQEAGRGVSYQVLARDPERERVSMVVRLSPRASYPRHTHADVEELYLLEGELWIDRKKVIPGGFYRAEAGSSDQLVWSETGCTCVLLTSTRDVLH
jgi:anti-sigma factor ChrR (cupin superfamily)